MTRVDLFDLHDRFKNDNILLYFSGHFSQEVIEGLVSSVKISIEHDNQSVGMVFDVLSVFIEQSQNIRNYTNSIEGKPYHHMIACSGSIALGKCSTGKYFISSGNLISREACCNLVQKLELINKKNKIELKRLYKEHIRKDFPEGSIGAGLGFIDMARKSKDPLDYSIREINSDFSFFSLTVTV